MGWFDDMGGKTTLPAPEEALPGRDQAIEVPKRHHVLGTSLTEYPPNSSRALLGMGCFWGVERLFWHQPGVFTTAVGYSGGYTPNPTYEEVCSGRTGHNEVVLVIFDPGQLTFQQLLKLFWENHNPTQGMRQANDRGTQYRSAIYWFDESQRQQAEQSRSAYQGRLDAAPGAPVITTEIKPAGPFYFAEPYHQQYLAKNPGGYCNLQTHDKTGFPALEI